MKFLSLRQITQTTADVMSPLCGFFLSPVDLCASSAETNHSRGITIAVQILEGWVDYPFAHPTSRRFAVTAVLERQVSAIILVQCRIFCFFCCFLIISLQFRQWQPRFLPDRTCSLPTSFAPPYEQ